jgi:hypothetical protein
VHVRDAESSVIEPPDIGPLLLLDEARRKIARMRAVRPRAEEPFHDLVVGTDLESDHSIELFTPCREHDDRKIGVETNPTSKIPSVAVGKHDIQKDQIRRLSVQGGVSLRDRGGNFGVDPSRLR